jgi:dynein heavy chain 1
MSTNTHAWKDFLSAPLAEKCIPKFGTADGNAKDGVVAAWHNLLLINALRPERLLAGAAGLVSLVFGPEFLYVEEPDLSRVLDSAPEWLHSFLLTSTAGFDTSGRVEALALARRVSCSVIALGSPEGYEAADKAISLASTRGTWVLLKNVHLAVDWLQQVDKKLHRISAHGAFRLFMTMEISASLMLPSSLVASAQVVVYEPPTGIKASLQQSFRAIPAERLTREPVERTRLHLLLSWLHAVVLGRLRYSDCNCPLGWSKAYEFSEMDLRTAADTIDLWVDRAANGRSNLAPDCIPWEAIRELVALCYGGRIDNEFDEKALRSFLDRFLCQEAYSLNHPLVYVQPPQETASAPAPILVPEGRTSKAFLEWIVALPDSQVPSWVGLPLDADMILLTQQGSAVLEGWRLLQSAQADEEAVVGRDPGNWSRSLAATVKKWLAQMLEAWDAPALVSEDPVRRSVCREMQMAAQIHQKVKTSLERVLSCLTQKATTDNEIRALISRLSRGDLPDDWRRHHCVPGNIKFDGWMSDLIQLRLRRLHTLSSDLEAARTGGGLRVWLGGLFQPGAFLTATRQWCARLQGVALEKLSLHVLVSDDGAQPGGSECDFFVEGAMLHGARWDRQAKCLAYGGSQPVALPPLIFRWVNTAVDKPSNAEDKDIVDVPIYINIERATLLCSVRLRGEGGGGGGGGGVPFFEMGTAITLWSDP